jgi:hypothetical protein
MKSQLQHIVEGSWIDRCLHSKLLKKLSNGRQSNRLLRYPKRRLLPFLRQTFPASGTPRGVDKVADQRKPDVRHAVSTGTKNRRKTSRYTQEGVSPCVNAVLLDWIFIWDGMPAGCLMSPFNFTYCFRTSQEETPQNDTPEAMGLPQRGKQERHVYQAEGI